MPAPSTAVPDWATNTNHAAGSDPWSGLATKVDPGAGVYATGFIPDQQPPAEWFNYLFNLYSDWIQWLESWRTGDGVTRSIFLSALEGVNASGASWAFTSAVASSAGDNEEMQFFLTGKLPHGATVTRVAARVDPGAARSTTDRMEIRMYKTTPDIENVGSGTVSQVTVVSAVEDDGTSNQQTIESTGLSLSISDDGVYSLSIRSGDDGGAHASDSLYGCVIEYTDPGPVNAGFPS